MFFLYIIDSYETVLETYKRKYKNGNLQLQLTFQRLPTNTFERKRQLYINKFYFCDKIWKIGLGKIIILINIEIKIQILLSYSEQLFKAYGLNILKQITGTLK